MKKYCKDIVLDADFIEKCIYECFKGKWNRSDVHRYLSKYSKRSQKKIKELTKNRYEEGRGYVNYRYMLAPEIRSIAEQLSEEIKTRAVVLQSIKKRLRYDTSSHKQRNIGIESIKQQILDYVVVNGLMEMLIKKIGENQFACVPGRGQKYGKMKIEKWIKRHPDKCRYVVKADIKKCYPSINTRTLKKLIHKYVKNDALIYLTELLVDTYGGGLSIGSYLSTWLCNFYLSMAYRYASQKLTKIKHKRNGECIARRLIFKIAFWMDDIVMFSPRKADAKIALKMFKSFLKKELSLEIKSDWRLYKMGMVDIMGYKIQKEFTTIRSKTFVKIRRAYIKAERDLRMFNSISKRQAQRLISFYGKIKETNSNNFRKKYKVDYIIHKAKRRVSFESKIFNKAATCALAGA